MRTACFTIFSSLCILTLLAGCSLVGGTGQLEKARNYRVTPVVGWKEAGRSDSDQAFRTESGNLVSLTSSCNRNTGASLEVLTRQLMMGTRNSQVQKQKHQHVGNVDGLLTEATAKFEGTLLYLNFFVAKSKNCVFDFSLMGPKAIVAKDTEDFLKFVASLEHG